MNTIYNEIFSLMVPNLIENKPNKAVWIFQNHINETTGKKLKVEAVSRESNQIINLIPEIDMTIGSSMDTNETKISSSITFPSKGEWKLDVYVNNNFVGDIILTVNSN